MWIYSIAALYGSAFFLPPLDSRQPAHPLLLFFGILGPAVFDAALCLHIYKAWRRLPRACNRPQYALWMSFVTVAVLGLMSHSSWEHSATEPRSGGMMLARRVSAG